jgi:hypothetical protein
VVDVFDESKVWGFAEKQTYIRLSSGQEGVQVVHVERHQGIAV